MGVGLLEVGEEVGEVFSGFGRNVGSVSPGGDGFIVSCLQAESLDRDCRCICESQEKRIPKEITERTPLPR